MRLGISFCDSSMKIMAKGSFLRGICQERGIGDMWTVLAVNMQGRFLLCACGVYPMQRHTKNRFTCLLPVTLLI